jgi:hypothetical protein
LTSCEQNKFVEISHALLGSLIINVFYYPISLRAPQTLRCTGKCEEEGSSGGGDDAAELGIGKFYGESYGKTVHLHKSPFTLANVGGVFLVLGFGCLFALIVAIIEFLWNVKKIAVEEKVRKGRQ